jgi:hypothetical protein
MKTLRIFQPYGAHLRFDGIDEVQISSGGFIRFHFEPRDEHGVPREGIVATAMFNLATISGYSFEAPEENVITPDKSIVVP